MICGVYIFVGIYLFVNFLITLYVYHKSKAFYKEAYITKEEGLEIRQVSLHDKYKEFKKYDKLSVFRIFIGINLLFWVKLILFIFIKVTLIITLR